MTHRLQWDLLLETDTIKAHERSNFEKDYDRIIFSQAFRRLARKTQVHPLAVNDHVHNRMSHSLEVSIVGRSIVNTLVSEGIIPQEYSSSCATIVMAAGLGHDMGNPPFGHIGEQAIAKWVKANAIRLVNLHVDQCIINTYNSYDGNAQNFHIFTSFEYFKEKPLSCPTKATLVKYPIESSPESNKSGYFYFDRIGFEECFKKLGLYIDDRYVRHPLSFIMEAADDICYSIMDIDDAIEMGFLHTGGKEFIEIVESIFGASLKNGHESAFRMNRGEIIDKAIKAIVTTYKDNIDLIMNGAVPNRTDLIKLGEVHPILNSIKLFKYLAKKQIFKHRRKVKFEAASFVIISKILDHWLTAFEDYHKCDWDFEKCDSDTKKIFELFEMYEPSNDGIPMTKEYGLIQAIDYIGGMTDRYANELAQSLSGNIL
jgi:dGTPase